jgi:monofunctional biosynthetic peptidoglycan transglycosylase
MHWFRKSKKSARSKQTRLARYIMAGKWTLWLLAVFALLDAGYILGLMPDWKQYEQGPVQKSQFIKQYEYERVDNPRWPPLRWIPVSIDKRPEYVIRSVVVAEDARFFQHSGFDQEAFKNALEYNLSQGRIVYGGSTISQQTTKNMFLSPSRNPLRKWHEFVLTHFMESNISKQRIMEIYLNVAEFGRGIYGVEAASLVYWNKSVRHITPGEAVELAASLPAPVKHNPNTRTEYFIRHRNKIRAHLGMD